MKTHETNNYPHANKNETRSIRLPSSHFTLSCPRQQIRVMAQVVNSENESRWGVWRLFKVEIHWFKAGKEIFAYGTLWNTTVIIRRNNVVVCLGASKDTLYNIHCSCDRRVWSLARNVEVSLLSTLAGKRPPCFLHFAFSK